MLFIQLLDFSPIKPDLGLILWTSVIFLLFLFMMSKMAFKPIANALRSRENDIQSSLDEAKKAKAEMASMKAENEKLLVEAREERAAMLKDAKEAKSQIISEAKTNAKLEANKILESAKVEIVNQKNAAMVEMKNQVGSMALDIAEKVIKKELQNDAAHQSFVNTLVSEIKLN